MIVCNLREKGKKIKRIEREREREIKERRGSVKEMNRDMNGNEWRYVHARARTHARTHAHVYIERVS